MNLTLKLRILEKCISVKDAAKYSGYSQQYLRRLLRNKKLIGLKVGQLWLIEVESLERLLIIVINSKDQRFEPQ